MPHTFPDTNVEILLSSHLEKRLHRSGMSRSSFGSMEIFRRGVRPKRGSTMSQNHFRWGSSRTSKYYKGKFCVRKCPGPGFFLLRKFPGSAIFSRGSFNKNICPEEISNMEVLCGSSATSTFSDGIAPTLVSYLVVHQLGLCDTKVLRLAEVFPRLINWPRSFPKGSLRIGSSLATKFSLTESIRLYKSHSFIFYFFLFFNVQGQFLIGISS